MTPDTAEFAGKVVLVTAAAGSGVGQAVARRFAHGGADIAVTDVHERRTAQVAASIAADHPDSTVLGLPLDVGDIGNIDRVVAEVLARWGRVDVLINNAAVNWPGPIWDYPLEHYQRTFAVNVTGPWYLARQLMPAMREHGGGAIINVTSGAVQDGGGFGTEPVYAITKGALETLTRALAHDGGPYGIRVNSLSVGIVADSKFMADHPDQLERSLPMLPLGKHVVATDVAEAAAFLASDDRSGRITGDILSVNGGAVMRL
ncbi:MAG TPA: SDR family oxidoreductase [Mycobacteriales bacterium]|nr:SDR family oxidoreductase [Mycobacteriales bacterium]